MGRVEKDRDLEKEGEDRGREDLEKEGSVAVEGGGGGGNLCRA